MYSNEIDLPIDDYIIFRFESKFLSSSFLPDLLLKEAKQRLIVHIRTKWPQINEHTNVFKVEEGNIVTEQVELFPTEVYLPCFCDTPLTTLDKLLIRFGLITTEFLVRHELNMQNHTEELIQYHKSGLYGGSLSTEIFLERFAVENTHEGEQYLVSIYAGYSKFQDTLYIGNVE